MYKYFVRKLSLVIIISVIILLGVQPHEVYADTSLYSSAGWVASDPFNPPSFNAAGCQLSDDGLYCSRPRANTGSGLYFGSFGQLEDFKIPINSTIDKLRVRVKGRSDSNMTVSVTNAYNRVPFQNQCQISSSFSNFFLGLTNKTIELHIPVSGASLANCVTANNINFRNLTLNIIRSGGSAWSADIDNFEIAFDYTPPAVTPAPVVFQEGQRGTVWEIGPDKSNLKKNSNLENVVSVAAGSDHMLFLKSDGTVWSRGRNDYGQLGDGTIGGELSAPVKVRGAAGVEYLTEVKAIAAAQWYSVALKRDGTVWTWGFNSYGYRGTGVGINDGSNKLVYPTQVKSSYFSNITAIVAGGQHSLVLNQDGTIVGWGMNNYGQIGIGCYASNCSTVRFPVRVSSIGDVAEITAGREHSLAVKRDGTVWGWGRTSEWQLGEGVTSINSFGERPSPVQIPELKNIKFVSSRLISNFAVNAEGKILEWGGEFRLRVPKEIPGISNPLAISAGRSSFSPGVTGHVIKSDGTLWQLYINDIPPKQVPHLKDVVAVASGDGTPALAVINSTGEVLGDSTGPDPFLDLPWDYENKLNNPKKMKHAFSESALAINSYFDHSYPVLGFISEVATASANTTSFRNIDEPSGYSSHNGYDWGFGAHLSDGDDVLAAASGSAEIVLEKNSGGAGNVVKITHQNGYQTWYQHLYADGLVKGDVQKGEKIGKMGHTGNCYSINSKGARAYNTPSCAHIHFSVFQDKDGNGSFSDNLPDGVTDPFGWMPTVEVKDRAPDPWEIFTFKQNNLNKSGNKSTYLWRNKIPGVKQTLSSSGGTINIENYSVKIDPDASLEGSTIEVQIEPGAKASESLKTVGSTSLSITLKDKLGKLVTLLSKPLFVGINFSEADISKFKIGTVFVYSSTDRVHWTKEKSLIDYINKTVTAEVDHLTYFALMGERADTISPTTMGELIGNGASGAWYRSDVGLTLNAQDNDGGLGIEQILYKIEGEDWNTYSTPLNFTEEQSYKVSFYSVDKDNNVEDVKSAEFHIDKTPPATVASATGTLGLKNWYTSDVKAELNAVDNASGIDKSEYSLDNGETFQAYEGEILISKEGVSEIFYRSVDKAGNVEIAKKIVLNIDKTPPSTVVYTSGSRGEDNWYRSNVQVALNGIDDVSGYKTSFYSLDNGESYKEYFTPIALSSEEDYKILYYSVDNAGNIEDKKSIEIRIDKTAPIASINASPSRLWPANGKMVDVRISGSVDEENPLDTNFIIKDEYGLIEPVLSNFNQTIKLQAKRNGNDLDGRAYKIEAVSSDLAGNEGNASVEVIVPHDQRN